MASLFRFFAAGWRVPVLWLFLILLAAFVLFLEFIVDVGGDAQTPPPPTPVIEPGPDSGSIPPPNRSLLTEAQIVSVICGVTIDAQIAGRVVRVRYYGSDSPERDEPCAAEATARNRQSVQGESVFL